VQSDPFPNFTTLSQKQLGQVFDATSHEVGRWLREAGLRDGSEPTAAAQAQGIAMKVTTAPGAIPFWAWDKVRTIAALEAAGHRRAGATDILPERKRPTLRGPFALKANGGDGYEIVNRDGETVIWCRGDEAALRLQKLLDLADRCGKLS
jgi:hypothetical protein